MEIRTRPLPALNATEISVMDGQIAVSFGVSNEDGDALIESLVEGIAESKAAAEDHQRENME